MTRPEIDSTIQLVTFAGSETSATTMSASTWFLLNNPDKMQRLKKELRDVFKRADEITVPSVSNLPFLEAVLKEAMRIHPPAAVALPRYVDRPVTIAGHQVPTGVSASCREIEIHRHALSIAGNGRAPSKDRLSSPLEFRRSSSFRARAMAARSRSQIRQR